MTDFLLNIVRRGVGLDLGVRHVPAEAETLPPSMVMPETTVDEERFVRAVPHSAAPPEEAYVEERLEPKPPTQRKAVEIRQEEDSPSSRMAPRIAPSGVRQPEEPVIESLRSAPEETKLEPYGQVEPVPQEQSVETIRVQGSARLEPNSGPGPRPSSPLSQVEAPDVPPKTGAQPASSKAAEPPQVLPIRKPPLEQSKTVLVSPLGTTAFPRTRVEIPSEPRQTTTHDLEPPHGEGFVIPAAVPVPINLQEIPVRRDEGRFPAERALAVGPVGEPEQKSPRVREELERMISPERGVETRPAPKASKVRPSTLPADPERVAEPRFISSPAPASPIVSQQAVSNQEPPRPTPAPAAGLTVEVKRLSSRLHVAPEVPSVPITVTPPQIAGWKPGVAAEPVTKPVEVHIGTVEVHAVQTDDSQPPAVPQPPPVAQAQGFDEYARIRHYLMWQG